MGTSVHHLHYIYQKWQIISIKWCTESVSLAIVSVGEYQNLMLMIIMQLLHNSDCATVTNIKVNRIILTFR